MGRIVLRASPLCHVLSCCPVRPLKRNPIVSFAQEVDSERARNRLESERREATLKAEKEALSKACEKDAADLGSAWAAVEAAAGFSASSSLAGGDGSVKVEGADASGAPRAHDDAENGLDDAEVVEHRA